MAGQLVALVVALVVAVCGVTLAGAAAQATSPPGRPLPKNFKVVTPGGLVLSCPDTAGKKGCKSKCDKRCPDSCIVMCPSCKTFCMCDFYPGISCRDTRFTGGDRSGFYFHGKKNQDFCIVSDTNLHINAHFIGKHKPATSRDFTRIQALGIRFADHRVFMGAKKTSKWSNMVDRWEMTFDGEPIDIPT